MGRNEELIRAAYAGFNRRDAEAVLALMQPEVDWPNGMEGGRVRGREAVRAYWLRQWGMVDPHVEPLQVSEDAGGATVVEVHQVVRDLGGAVLQDVRLRHVYAIRDGLVAGMEIEEPMAG